MNIQFFPKRAGIVNVVDAIILRRETTSAQ
jgi:hypothetical protein